MVEPKPPQTRVIPEGALLHFALPQREYAAMLSAVQYFAKKLQNPKERELAQRALQFIQSPTGFSLPSEAQGAEETLPERKEKKEKASSTTYDAVSLRELKEYKVGGEDQKITPSDVVPGLRIIKPDKKPRGFGGLKR